MLILNGKHTKKSLACGGLLFFLIVYSKRLHFSGDSAQFRGWYFSKNFGQRHQKSENLKSRNESIVNSSAVCATSTKGSPSVDVFYTGAARGVVLLVASNMASCTTHSHTARFPRYLCYFWAHTELLHNRCAQTTILQHNWPIANSKRNACTHLAPPPPTTNQPNAGIARMH